MCCLVPFYGVLLFSCVLSSSVIAESELFCLVLILNTVACVLQGGSNITGTDL